MFFRKKPAPQPVRQVLVLPADRLCGVRYPEVCGEEATHYPNGWPLCTNHWEERESRK